MSYSDHNFLSFSHSPFLNLLCHHWYCLSFSLSIVGTLLVSLVSLYFCIHEYDSIQSVSLTGSALLTFATFVSSKSGTASCVFLLLFQHIKYVIGENLKILAKKSTTKLYHQHYLGPLFHTPENILLVFCCDPHNQLLWMLSNFPQIEISLKSLDSYFPYLSLSFTFSSLQVSIQSQSCRVC